MKRRFATREEAVRWFLEADPREFDYGRLRTAWVRWRRRRQPVFKAKAFGSSASTTVSHDWDIRQR